MLFFSFGSSSAGCNFSWDYNPVMAFDNISGTGKVIVRERICSVTLKSGDSLDVNAWFGSDVKTASDVLGYGWNLNITSISATKCAPYVYEFKTPDNASHWLRFNGGKYRSEAWILAEKRNQLFVTSTCGKEVTISNGRVRRIKFSSGAQVNYNYDDKGRLVSLYDNDKKIAEFEYSGDGDSFTLRTFPGREEYKISLKSIKGFGKILNSIERPGGDYTRFTYDFQKGGNCTMEVLKNYRGRKYSFSGNDGEIRREDIVSDNPSEDGYLYNVRNMDGAKSENKFIERTKISTNRKDIWYEGREGIAVSQLDGGPKTTRYFLTNGIYYGKPRKEVTEYPSGEKEETLYSYDDKGRLVGEYKNGNLLYRLKISGDGKAVSCISPDGGLKWKKMYDEKNRVISYELSDGRKTVFTYLNGGMVKAVMIRDGEVISSGIFNENLNKI